MLKSMTGFGQSSLETEVLSISAEIKSLNSKFQDINIKLPREFADKELEVRNILGNALERGKIGLLVNVERKGEVKPAVSVNRELVKQYYKDLKETADMLGVMETDLLKIALTMPKAVNADIENEDSAKEWELTVKVIQDAIKKCEGFRMDEGKTLEGKLESYIHKIDNLLFKVIEVDPQRIKNVREKIFNHIEEYNLADQIDKNRFEQELIYYIEKLDISEEKVRLKSHLQYFLDAMKGQDANGKKLGFISQEIGREINTIGSKANDATIQRLVVEMKEELEKIKEQSMNIL